MSFILKYAVILSVIAFAKSDKLLELELNTRNAIFAEYNPSIRPPGKNGTGPVIVEVNTYVRSIKNIDDFNMHYDVQLTFRQEWQDTRLRFDIRTKELRYISMSNVDHIWTPDFFFSNEETGHFHKMITPNNLVRIFPDGKILYSTRVSLRLACPMDLRHYPMDNQVCDLKGASYGYTTDDIEFFWKKEAPVQVTNKIFLRKFVLNNFMTDYCTSTTNTGTYSCLKIGFMFSRNVYHYLQRAYMPTAALVLLSWIVFWLNPKCSSIRLGIWIGVFVSILVVTISITSNTPEVSYATALDIWMGVCVCYVLFVVLEICLVANTLRKEEALLGLQNQMSCDDGVTDKHSMRIEDGKGIQVRNYTSLPLRWLNKYKSKAQRIDVISRFLFPFTFILFNFIYWLTHASGTR